MGGSLDTTGLRACPRARSIRGGCCGGLISGTLDRCQDGTINIFENKDKISQFGFWPVSEQCAPPTHQDDDDVNSSGATDTEVHGATSRLNLVPPLSNIGAEGSCFELVVPLVFVPIFDKAIHNLWLFPRRKTIRSRSL